MKARYIFGIILVLLGIATLFAEAGLFELSYIIGDWWPILIVVLGVYMITRARHSIFGGAIVTLVGLALLADNFDIHINFWSILWALILIIAGIWLFSARLFKRDKNRTISDNEINFQVFLSGREEKLVSDDFHGGTISAFMGGMELDLRNTHISGHEALIDISVIMGGCDLYVPANWRIIVKGVPILGGFSDKTRNDVTADLNAPTLKINYMAIMG